MKNSVTPISPHGQVALEISNLTVQAWTASGPTTIVKDFNLTLRRGEVIGLVGESGSGKTTIGLAALGFARGGCKITNGEVKFNGRDILKLEPRERRLLRGDRVVYVAQSASVSFNPSLPLIRQVTETILDRKKLTWTAARQEAIKLFALLQLPQPETIGHRFAHELSGGQLQRLMAAMAMLPSPDLVVFDEPTTALDVTTQVEVLAAIKDLVRRFNTASIYISHDLSVVAQLADRVCVMRHGQMVEEGATTQILKAPGQPYTKSLWAVRGFTKEEAAPSDVLLKIDQVSASYGTCKVLEEVSFTVGCGRTVAVVGESGSGKSTLAKVITGLMQPTEGTLSFAGDVLNPMLARRPRQHLRQIQIISQSSDAALNPRHRIREILERPLEVFFGLSTAERRKRVLDILKQVELSPDLLNRFPRELSGGQKQRICIARALAAEPALIICDEATSALDQLVQEEILRLLTRLQAERGISYLFITHDIATVRAIADRVVVMRHGKIVQEGTRQAVFTPPHPPYTELLLSSVPRMDPNWLAEFLARRNRQSRITVLP